MAVVICLSLGFGYTLVYDFYQISKATTQVEEAPVITCDMKYYKARMDCRRLLVDKHWDKWKENRATIKVYCDHIASEMYCSES